MSSSWRSGLAGGPPPAFCSVGPVDPLAELTVAAARKAGSTRRALCSLPSRPTTAGELSTGCTECCGNVDYSTFANCGIFAFSTPLRRVRTRPYIPSCAEHGAGVGRSNTGRLYEAARKGRSGKSIGVVDETATGSANFFGPIRPLAAPRVIRRSSRIAAMHPPRPPSIDQGVIALIWAIGLGMYIYFGLLAVGASGATAIVISLVSFAAIWLFVRLRGEDSPRAPAQPTALVALRWPRRLGAGAAPARRRACARARCRAARRAARAPGRPADRGSPGARRGAVRRGRVVSWAKTFISILYIGGPTPSA